ncbi:MAG: protein-glutamate O-methyltransferase CheR [Bdellovibrionaceae bacterium]|nr:protein-glutamate O-methyltransferase CheR [Pseudobdellovibrionaceae bacterium]
MAKANETDNIYPTLKILDQDIDELLAVIYEKYSYDFRSYAMTSVRRRLGTAMMRFDLQTVADVRKKLLEDTEFFLPLLQYLTVPTSEMFRDPLFFLAFREKVVPILKTYPSIRFWVAGCSTGEELYSYAIILREENLLERTTIYATDINPVSLKKAESGIFSADRMKEYSQNYQKSGSKGTLSDYFSVAYDSALIDKTLRKNVVFADHSLATDSVFGEMQFVSCRNVMIYFDGDLQNRAIGLFHDSLVFGGFLGIGSKESLRFSNWSSHFQEFAKTERIYQRR